MIKRLKMSYMLYNFFQKKRLAHNIPLYKKIGLKKSYFSPISSKDFVNIDTSLLKNNHTISASQTTIFKESSPEIQQNILDFDKKGYVLLNQYLSENQVDEINQEIHDLLEKKEVEFRYRNKIMFAIDKSPVLKKYGIDKKFVELLSSLIKGNAELFQSINFLMGSEQKTHSDSIHMTTFPLGGLLGVWIALEDVNDENGPLHYYPESHQLPYYLNSDYDNEGNYFLIGDKKYTAYEKMLEQKIREMPLKKEIFHAKKGDVFIWHANLLHGGEPHLNKEKTRKSMVFHYFDTNCICYHEITQRPSLMR